MGVPRSKAFWSLGFLVLALALPAEALQVSPDALALPCRPRKSARGVFILTNDGENAVDVAVAVTPLFGFESGAKGALHVSPRRFRLAPGARRRVNVRCGPQRTLSGEKACQVAFTASDPRTSWLSVRLSQAVYLVSDKTSPDARLDSFDAREESPGEWVLKATVSNPGDVHWMSRAVLSLLKPDGGVYERHSHPDSSVLFPGGRTTFTWSWKDPVPPVRGLVASVGVFYRPPFGEARKLEGRAPLLVTPP